MISYSIRKVIDEKIGFTDDNVKEWAHLQVIQAKSANRVLPGLQAIPKDQRTPAQKQQFDKITNQNLNEYRWLNEDGFNSWESYIFAQELLKDTTDIPSNIVSAAQRRSAQWGGGTPANASTPSTNPSPTP